MTQEENTPGNTRSGLPSASSPDRYACLREIAAASRLRPTPAKPQARPVRAPEPAQADPRAARRAALVNGSSAAPPAAPALAAAGVAARVRGEGGDRSRNGVIAWLVVALVLLAPLPVGSNRPLLWSAVAVLVGGIGAVHALRGFSGARGAVPGLGRMWPVLLLALVQPLWGLVQAVPLGAFAAGLALPVELPAGLRPVTLSLDPNASLIGALRMAGHVLFFLLVLAVMTRAERVMQGLRILFWGIVCWAVYGMATLTILGDVGLWGKKTDYLGFATGPFINRNSFAAFLGIGCVIGVALLAEMRMRPKMRRERRHGFLTEGGLRALIQFSGLALIVITLFATGSRMGLAASLVAMGVTAGAMRLAAPPMSTNAAGFGLPKWLVAGLVGAVLLGGAVLFGVQTAERALFSESDLAHRMQIFKTAGDLILIRPLVGFGLDAFPLAFELARPDTFLNAFTYSDAHSSYLENWVEGGLVFGSVPVLVAFFYLRHLIGALRAGGRAIGAVAAALGAITLVALHSLVDFPFEIEANVLLLCLVCAMGVSWQRGTRQETGKAES